MCINVKSNKSYYIILLVLISIFSYMLICDKKDHENISLYSNLPISHITNIVEQKQGTLVLSYCQASNISLRIV